MPIGKKQTREFIKILEDIRRVAIMRTADFSGKIEAPLPKTRREATKFIRETTRSWRRCWLIEPLDGVIKKLESYL